MTDHHPQQQTLHMKHLDILLPFLNARAAFVPSPAELLYPMMDAAQAAAETEDTEQHINEDSSHPAAVRAEPEGFTEDIFAIHLDGHPVGYRRSYKSAVRAIERIKRELTLKHGWDVWLQWTEWKPRSSVMQHFVLESCPYNSLMSYTRKEHDITLYRVKYFE